MTIIFTKLKKYEILSLKRLRGPNKKLKDYYLLSLYLVSGKSPLDRFGKIGRKI
jgi:hypothetical protein